MTTERLNMDRSRRVVINTAGMEWENSPAAGVERKKLEREASESGQVTSVVRYQPGSRFRPHIHPGGEEIFVIDGIFEDENGQYSAGSYLRNPPGSSHAPGTENGCVLLVKLNMFQKGDQASVRIDTTQESWLPGLVPGLEVMPLHTFGEENTALVRWKPGTRFQSHVHARGEEIFVLEGGIEDEEGLYQQGTWIRNPPGSSHLPFSNEGSTIFVKTGHITP
jgi:anti-sigma factor ChrR (cupin superfamily)